MTVFRQVVVDGAVGCKASCTQVYRANFCLYPNVLHGAGPSDKCGMPWPVHAK